MKTLLALLISCVSLFAATTYPVITDNSNRTFPGGVTNVFFLNSNAVSVGTLRVTGAVTLTNSSSSLAGDAFISSQQTLSYSSGTNLTVDATKLLHYISLTNTAYFAQPSGLAAGASFTVILRQDSTGGRAVTFNTNYWRFPNGTQPSVTTNASAIDVISCVADPFGTNVLAVISQKFQ
jgi:hypothetical protein